ncbi:MAG TPA: adenylate/guanylate cyclase domain-containing protein [Polyangia bacterium]|nr:adenylate/guanylate cyclase domain-containing protein [Polyangia bacterium]
MTRRVVRSAAASGSRPTRAALASRAALDRLLAARNEHPERLAQIDLEIHRRFAQTRAVMVLDMCGFSRLTMRHGITHFLAMIHRLHGIVRPIVVACGGEVVKTEADNVFAVFGDVLPATAAAREIQNRLRAANVFLPEDWDLHVSLGIGYGEILMIGRGDLFGSEVNIASKLGEDVAGRGETLLTQAAQARLPAGASTERRPIQLGQLAITAFKLLDR